MGRRAKYDRDSIRCSALELISEDGPNAATIAAIAGRIGAPTGSIYHRYGSRELLLADLWLTVVKSFQDGMIEIIGGGGDPVESGVRAALYMPGWVREHLNEARLLLLHRREDFVGGDWPEEVRERAEQVGKDLVGCVQRYAAGLYGKPTADNLRRVRFALLDLPYGAVKYYVQAGKKPPDALDELIETACRAVLEDGIERGKRGERK